MSNGKRRRGVAQFVGDVLYIIARQFLSEDVEQTLIPGWGSTKCAPYSYDRSLRYGYARNEVVFACVNEIATSASEPVMQVHDEDDNVMPDHPIRQLIANPNRDLTEVEFWESTLVSSSLAGNAFWWKQRSASGRPVALWSLSPGHMRYIRKKGERQVRFWEYTVPGTSGEKLYYPPEDILHFKTANPLDDVLGLPQMAVAARAVDTDNSATDYTYAFFENAAVPMGLLKTRRRVRETDADKIIERWRAKYGGRRGWHDIALLDSDTDYQRVGLTQAEMGMPDLSSLSETRICMIWQVPPILIGAYVGLMRATYANYGQARVALWMETLGPIYRRMEDRMSLGLGKDFGLSPATRPCRFDYTNVHALQPVIGAKRESARKAFVAGGMLVNEYRKAIGLKAVKDGNVFLWQLSMIAQPATYATLMQALEGSSQLQSGMDPLALYGIAVESE